ncbi:WxL domain-containing protein [Enterococcus faecalis]|uniref:WxL domain-containing protein n=1 Tax=Enterococcus TaxID=1350 RepID=UPI0019DC08BA|nr:WxL domain-containing protein [Enterococcus faecalis]EGO8143060.1 WxL domain-containing protein [Enterococcus faecalis]EGO8363194.1 WxL domain-containing protein [Enterococcus faecalis]EGO8408915.1 WxL domain-containing protein [Enterococcus faecalis]EGO9143776.1 WxL domain-containing protein [Enterococcus faecalis]
MKKKLLASLLVSSAVVGASLAPLSAQAVTTGNTPVQVEFGGGTLPDGDSDGENTVRPDPGATNTDFDLLYIPEKISFAKTAISDDLSAISSEDITRYGVGDLRGTKEGWHVTATIPEMTNGEETLTGTFSFTQTGYALTYNEVSNKFSVLKEEIFTNDPSAPEFLATSSITIGGGAALVGNAVSGKGQGMWNSYLTEKYLNITTPYQQIKAGTYTGNITWNLVAGPSI